MATDSASARKTTVLLVDDESAITLLFEMDLTRRGYCVLKAHSASEAIKMSEDFQTPVDVLVADWKMPDMTGDELACLLWKQQPEMKLILISGYASAAEKIAGFPRNQAAFAQKPLPPSKLDSMIKEILRTAGPFRTHAA